MEVTNIRPTNEAAQLAAASLQSTRFQERRLREAQSDVRNQAVYFSPVIRIDTKTSSAIIQYRDGSTGEVEREYPTPPKQGAYVQADAKSSVAQPEVKAVKIDDAPVKEEKPAEHIDENA